MDPVERVVERLRERGYHPQPNGQGWKALCPGHDDHNPSLDVRDGDIDECAVVKCRAGCDTAELLAVIDLTMADLFAKPRRNKSEIVATYDYRSESGDMLFQVCRMSPKSFRQRRPDGRGGWEWKLGDVRRVPYRLGAVLKGIKKDRWIFVVEGERDVHTLEQAGFVATCNSGGAGKWRPEWTPMFAGAKVAVIPDDDEPGRKHADQVARLLSPDVEVVKVIELDGLAEHQDVSDWLKSHDVDELKELVRDGEPWQPREPGTPTEPVVSERVVEVPDEQGDALLDDVRSFMARYVACSDAALDAATLWVADAFDISPRFFASSQEPGSGKTRFLEVLKVLVCSPLFMAHISEAYLFRRVAEAPTILHDEIDAVFGKKARDREELRAMLNAGWERGAVVGKVVGEGSKMRPQDFQVFAPVALAGLGQLPETLAQRSIVVRMKRRKADEPVAKFRRRDVGPEAEQLRNRLEAWCARRIDLLERARPTLPERLSDRAEDAWEPLVAIADEAGGSWHDRSRAAAVDIVESRVVDDASIGVLLLADVKSVFDDPDVSKTTDPDKGDGLASGDLAGHLARLEGRPWAEWGRQDKPLTANALARLLRGYDVRSGQHKMAGANMRGYLRSDFDDAWARNLPPPTKSVTDDNVLPAKPNNGKGGNTSSAVTHFSGGGAESDSDQDTTDSGGGCAVAPDPEREREHPPEQSGELGCEQCAGTPATRTINGLLCDPCSRRVVYGAPGSIVHMSPEEAERRHG